MADALVVLMGNSGFLLWNIVSDPIYSLIVAYAIKLDLTPVSLSDPIYLAHLFCYQARPDPSVLFFGPKKRDRRSGLFMS
jgi:hypothetical protein